MKKIFRLFPLAALIAASACEIPFALDNVSEPAYYVQYLPGAGMAQDIMVGYAEPAFEKPGKVKHDFSLSDVRVLVNGTPAVLAEKDADKAWNRHRLAVSTGSEIKPGDRIEVSVTGNGAPDASSSTVIPEPPAVASVDIVTATRDSSDVWQITLRLKEPVRDGEYIGLKAKKRNTYFTAKVPHVEIPDFPFDPGNPVMPFDEAFPGLPEIPVVTVDTTVVEMYFSPGQIASTADINSLDLDAYTSVSFQDGFISTGLFSGQPLMLLTSRQFAGGDTYTFYANSFDSFDFSDIDFGFDPEDGEAVPEDDGEVPVDPEEPQEPEVPEFDYIPLGYTEEYSLEVYRLTDEFYNYAKAQYLVAFNMLSNFGVTPPNFTYTNVQGGLGVVAGMSRVITPWIMVRSMEEDGE